mmetsp:Transcript_42926/g.48757  ORF Transcript_42926/g.48757 Transcript_42926/m.48757 type:complete len:96 (+) Transcript_42926:33-320(+)|eukprot:CAMPEP_0194145424 /NCGR_PEP_ID=MMETSP0152-20130528/17421_1 /TAXON_ID=1049557 /ORGANISM="Thalassiothrix antarctica, Strain L6-D1" /LENGTH=95 /DNA_ID=CAMNT_0038845659 /DNA_START=33 /DNA_END=320 /DNA_ORIENTATION=-
MMKLCALATTLFLFVTFSTTVAFTNFRHQNPLILQQKSITPVPKITTTTQYARKKLSEMSEEEKLEEMERDKKLLVLKGAGFVIAIALYAYVQSQ